MEFRVSGAIAHDETAEVYLLLVKVSFGWKVEDGRGKVFVVRVVDGFVFGGIGGFREWGRLTGSFARTFVLAQDDSSGG